MFRKLRIAFLFAFLIFLAYFVFATEYEIVGLSTYHNDAGDYSVDGICSVAISSDGNYLITSSYYDDYVSIMNITDKSSITPLATYHDIDGDYSVEGIYSVAISSDGNYLITSSYYDDYVSIMNITDKSSITPLATYYDIDGDYSVDGVYSVAISSDGNYLITSSSYDDHVSIMNITDKSSITPLATYHNDAGYYSVDGVYSVAISSDGNYLITSSYTDDYVSIMRFQEKIVLEDTCTCPGSGENWEVDMSDFCVISEACDLGTGNLTFINTGNFTCDAQIDLDNMEYPVTDQTIYIKSGCRINVG